MPRKEGLLVDLLAELSDDEVDQYVAHWQWRWDRSRVSGKGWDAWWCSKLLSAGLIEKRERRAG
jgi:hypothetical protein